jgi:hypothetical protein
MTSSVTLRSRPAEAVADLVAELGTDADLYAVFVTPGYDLDGLGPELRRWAGDRVVGCTSSGNIGPDGYEQSGVLAVALTGGGLRTRTIALSPMDDPTGAVERSDAELAGLRTLLDDGDGFALLLVDGAGSAEDLLAAHLMAALGDVPVIGGSAGDALTYDSMAVYHDGRFSAKIATVTMVRLDAPFRIFRLQHHEPSESVLVATDVDPRRRIVHAFNGRPAAHSYAETVELPADQLDPTVFSQHPLILRAAGSDWVRSITATDGAGALTLLAGVEAGDVLRVGRSVRPIQHLTECLAAIRAELGGIGGVLAFDCVLRRLEFEETGIAGAAGEILADNAVAGFSTYGEQFNGMHMNNTLVAVAFA